jgi:predicted amidohydrolase YtcJ
LPQWAAARRGIAAAELVLLNGRVHTLAGKLQQAVAIASGKIAYVGSDAGAQALAGPGTEVIDLGGRMVMPGIHDGHMHPLSGGLVLTAPSLNYRQLNLKEFVAAIRKLLARTTEEEPDGWLSVDLWDATAMDKLPTKEDLDKLETSRPIIVFALDGHIALANSRALAIGGVDASSPDPPGGEIRRGRNGEPNGILLDSAIGLVADKVPPLTAEQNARALAAAYAEMAKQGITSYLEASAGEEELAAMALLSDQGALTVRPSVAVYGDSELATDPAALLAHVEQRGRRSRVRAPATWNSCTPRTSTGSRNWGCWRTCSCNGPSATATRSTG